MNLSRLLHRLDPVAGGQTKSALYLSAGLVLLWSLGRPASALAASCHGIVEDQYVRVEWMYNLDGGQGVITLDCNGPDWPPTDQRFLSFRTRGLALTTVDTGAYNYSWMTGRDVNYAFSAITAFPVAINVSFPTSGVRLFDTQLEYGVATPHDSHWLSNSLPFVSVEAIPEPKTAGLMAAAAPCVAGIMPRRKRR